MKNNLNKQINKVDNFWKNLKEHIVNASEVKETVIDKLSEGYKDLIRNKELYTFNIEKEVESRELHKLETFKASCLNIKLPKFKGYDSAMDIFTFQSTFEKLYEKRTPRKILPNLLINNYLEDPALSLVKSVKDISEIWNQLKLAFGKPKAMLKKKICEINKVIHKIYQLLGENRVTKWLINISDEDLTDEEQWTLRPFHSNQE